MQRSLDMLADQLGRPRIDAIHINITPRPDYQITAERRAAFRERNSLDYAIYRYACDRLDP
jgi:hypothetical protein